jgi:hypothetical protein
MPAFRNNLDMAGLSKHQPPALRSVGVFGYKMVVQLPFLNKENGSFFNIQLQIAVCQFFFFLNSRKQKASSRGICA